MNQHIHFGIRIYSYDSFNNSKLAESAVSQGENVNHFVPFGTFGSLICFKLNKVAEWAGLQWTLNSHKSWSEFLNKSRGLSGKFVHLSSFETPIIMNRVFSTPRVVSGKCLFLSAGWLLSLRTAPGFAETIRFIQIMVTKTSSKSTRGRRVRACDSCFRRKVSDHPPGLMTLTIESSVAGIDFKAPWKLTFGPFEVRYDVMPKSLNAIGVSTKVSLAHIRDWLGAWGKKGADYL